MTETKPKRRWFQFSLRTIFVVITAWALLLPFVPPLIAKYRAWRNAQEWTQVGGQGVITPFPPFSCRLDDIGASEGNPPNESDSQTPDAE
jgi:hypothetical protein